MSDNYYYDRVMNSGLDVQFYGSELDDEVVSEIARPFMDPNTKVESLCLNCGHVGFEGVSALVKVLATNKVLQRLDLSFSGIGDEAAVALADGLKRNSTLLDLRLGSNKIGKDGATAIAKSLTIHHSTLQMLDLAHNQTGDDGAAAIAEALKANTRTPQEIWKGLANRNFRVNSTVVIAHTWKEALENRSALITIVLRGTQINT